MRGIPTRDEADADKDQIVGELQSMRQVMVMLSGRVRDHEDRPTSLETIHPGGEHAH